MTDHPILFNSAMVLAILSGRKTQTRRFAIGKNGKPSPWAKVRPGDLLWVRETWQKSGIGWNNDLPMGYLHYRATDKGEWKDYWGHWRPSIHMPRWASRLTLEVTEVRREPLQDISSQDVRQEGISTVSKDGELWKYGLADCDGLPGNDDYGWHWCDWELSPQTAFSKLWNSCYGPEAWKANPEMIVFTFRTHHRNIDTSTALAESEAA